MKYSVCVFSVFLLTVCVGTAFGDADCSCSGQGCSCSAHCVPPTPHAYCTCDPPPCSCGCYAKPPQDPPKMGATWTWFEVARILQQQVLLTDKTIALREIMLKSGLKTELIVFPAESIHPGKTGQFILLDLLRSASRRDGDVRVGGIPILSQPRLLDPSTTPICLRLTSASPADLFVFIWSFYGERWDFLLQPQVQNREFALSVSGVSLDELEGIVWDKLFTEDNSIEFPTRPGGANEIK